MSDGCACVCSTPHDVLLCVCAFSLGGVLRQPYRDTSKSRDCNTLPHTATNYHTLQHTAAHCKTPHTATHCCNTSQAWDTSKSRDCNTLPHTATHCHTLQHTATRCNTPHTATHCCNTSQAWDTSKSRDYQVPDNWSPYPLEAIFGGALTSDGVLGA